MSKLEVKLHFLTSDLSDCSSAMSGSASYISLPCHQLLRGEADHFTQQTSVGGLLQKVLKRNRSELAPAMRVGSADINGGSAATRRARLRAATGAYCTASILFMHSGA